MPRQRSGGRPSAPSRPAVAAPPARAPQQQQTRPMSTAPAQQRHATPPATAQSSQGPGLFGQMASTAAGVAVGSSIGHAIGGFFGGGSSAPAAEQQQYQQPADTYAQPGQSMDSALYNTNTSSSDYANAGPCAQDVTKFRACMDENRGDLGICGWYLDQLKACQAAARQY